MSTEPRQTSENDEIWLEPTIGIEDARADDQEASPAAFDGSIAGTAAETEIRPLLHTRLQTCACMVAMIYLVLTLWTWLTSDAGTWIVPAGRLARLALAAAIGGLLISGRNFTLRQLRALELALFGGLVVLLMLSQYFGDLAFIANGDYASLIATEKNGVMQMIVLMMLYGVLIPNDPRRAARVIAAMAIGPLLVLSVLLHERVNESRIATPWQSLILSGSNAIYLSLSAGVAIYTAFLLQGMRRELRNAKRLGQYRLGAKIGAGGMGEVYMAEHQLLKRPCALKLIKGDIARNSIALARFEREVQVAAMMSHPNSIQIFDYGHTDDGTFYYVMEFLPGLNSAEVVQQFGPMPPGRAIYLMRQVCAALREAHLQEIIHRDLKPANIFVAILGGECDVAKLLDFGLVKVNAPGSTDLTADHTVSGTPSYMSPEQAMADPKLDQRADLYSLGAILYFWLTGRPPFEGENATAVLIAHARDPVEPPSKHAPGIPVDLEQVVLRCLAKSADDRFPYAKSLFDALGSCESAADWDAASAETWWTERAEERLKLKLEEKELAPS